MRDLLKNKNLLVRRIEAQKALEGDKRRKEREIRDTEIRKKKEDIVKVENLRQERERMIKVELEKKKQLEIVEKKEAEIQKQARSQKLKTNEVENVHNKKLREERQGIFFKKIQVAKKEKYIKNSKDDGIKFIKKGLEELERIRTYKNDITETIKKQKNSVAQIVSEEKEKTRQEDQVKYNIVERKRPDNKNKVVFFAISIIVIILSGFLVYKFNGIEFIKTLIVPMEVIDTTKKLIVSAVIIPDIEKRISINSINTMELISDEIKLEIGDDIIKNIYLTTDTSFTGFGDKEGIWKISTTEDFLLLWEHAMPETLTRSLGKEFMIGVYSDIGMDNIPFLVFTTSSYAQAFAGMFQWEEAMQNSFNSLFNFKINKNEKIFIDRVVNGKDVRAIENDSGEMILFYSFIDEGLIVISSKEKVFIKILQNIR